MKFIALIVILLIYDDIQLVCLKESSLDRILYSQTESKMVAVDESAKLLLDIVNKYPPVSNYQGSYVVLYFFLNGRGGLFAGDGPECLNSPGVSLGASVLNQIIQIYISFMGREADGGF